MVLMRWEAAVVNEELPHCVRSYAWLKLLTFWSVIRGEDSTWITFASLKMVADSHLSGVLSQTKTSGPSKKVKLRAFQVSTGAYMVDPDWLQTGFNVWKGEDLDRQNFILLPDASMESLPTKVRSRRTESL